jgi:hypothetical protein
MFLSTHVHDKLVKFIDFAAPNEPLMVFGPPKSSKTAVLHDVLPPLAAARVSKLTPIFVKPKISLNETPSVAALRIWKDLNVAGKALEIDVAALPVPEAEFTFEHARIDLPRLVKSVALKMLSRNLQLWLLIDECHVCAVIYFWRFVVDV